MISFFENSIVRFFSIIVLQTLLFNNIVLFNSTVPFIYILFILIVPFEVNKTALLFISFVTGFLIDISFNSYGVHIGASVFAAYIRPYVLQYTTPRGGYDPNTQPLMRDYGFLWFLKYAAIITVSHHFVLYLFYTFSFEHFWAFMYQMTLNSIVTLALIMLSQFYIFRK